MVKGEKIVYVLIYCEIDNDYSKKSDIDIIGVYTTKKQAEEILESYKVRVKARDRDSRYYASCYITETKLNNMTKWIDEDDDCDHCDINCKCFN